MTNEDHDADVATFAEAEARAKSLHESPEDHYQLERMRDAVPKHRDNKPFSVWAS
jgi:hypothetical protein